MLDLTGSAAAEWYGALKAEREYEAGRRTWLARFRELQRTEGTEARHGTPPRPPAGPRKLTGAHTPWI